MPQSLQPDCPRLFVHMLHTATGMSNLIGAHGGIANDNHPIVGAVVAHQLHCGHAYFMAATVVFPEPFIDKIMKIEKLEIFELAASSGKQLLTVTNVIIHRAADIKQHQHFDPIVTLRAHFHIKKTGIFGRTTDGVIQV